VWKRALALNARTRASRSIGARKVMFDVGSFTMMYGTDIIFILLANGTSIRLRPLRVDAACWLWE
jgi:hypothetical protein